MDKIGRMFLRHFTTFARVNMLIKMKKNYLLWAVTAMIMLALQSCNNGKTIWMEKLLTPSTLVEVRLHN